MILKITIWILVLVGVVTACSLVYATYTLNLKFHQAISRGRFGIPQASKDQVKHVHDAELLVGFGRSLFRVYPRTWAMVLILIGALAMIIGVAFTLHVPVPPSS